MPPEKIQETAKTSETESPEPLRTDDPAPENTSQQDAEIPLEENKDQIPDHQETQDAEVENPDPLDSTGESLNPTISTPSPPSEYGTELLSSMASFVTLPPSNLVGAHSSQVNSSPEDMEFNRIKATYSNMKGEFAPEAMASSLLTPSNTPSLEASMFSAVKPSASGNPGDSDADFEIVDGTTVYFDGPPVSLKTLTPSKTIGLPVVPSAVNTNSQFRETEKFPPGKTELSRELDPQVENDFSRTSATVIDTEMKTNSPAINPSIDTFKQAPSPSPSSTQVQESIETGLPTNPKLIVTASKSFKDLPKDSETSDDKNEEIVNIFDDEDEEEDGSEELTSHARKKIVQEQLKRIQSLKILESDSPHNVEKRDAEDLHPILADKQLEIGEVPDVAHPDEKQAISDYDDVEINHPRSLKLAPSSNVLPSKGPLEDASSKVPLPTEPTPPKVSNSSLMSNVSLEENSTKHPSIRTETAPEPSDVFQSNPASSAEKSDESTTVQTPPEIESTTPSSFKESSNLEASYDGINDEPISHQTDEDVDLVNKPSGDFPTNNPDVNSTVAIDDVDSKTNFTAAEEMMDKIESPPVVLESFNESQSEPNDPNLPNNVLNSDIKIFEPAEASANVDVSVLESSVGLAGHGKETALLHGVFVCSGLSFSSIPSSHSILKRFSWNPDAEYC